MYVCTRIYIVIAVDSGIVITIKSYCGNCFSFPLHVHSECKYLQKKIHCRQDELVFVLSLCFSKFYEIKKKKKKSFVCNFRLGLVYAALTENAQEQKFSPKTDFIVVICATFILNNQI